jgi:hypothetical protein
MAGLEIPMNRAPTAILVLACLVGPSLLLFGSAKASLPTEEVWTFTNARIYEILSPVNICYSYDASVTATRTISGAIDVWHVDFNWDADTGHAVGIDSAQEGSEPAIGTLSLNCGQGEGTPDPVMKLAAFNMDCANPAAYGAQITIFGVWTVMELDSAGGGITCTSGKAIHPETVIVPDQAVAEGVGGQSTPSIPGQAITTPSETPSLPEQSTPPVNTCVDANTVCIVQGPVPLTPSIPSVSLGPSQTVTVPGVSSMALSPPVGVGVTTRGFGVGVQSPSGTQTVPPIDVGPVHLCDSPPSATCQSAPAVPVFVVGSVEVGLSIGSITIDRTLP